MILTAGGMGAWTYVPPGSDSEGLPTRAYWIDFATEVRSYTDPRPHSGRYTWAGWPSNALSDSGASPTTWGWVDLAWLETDPQYTGAIFANAPGNAPPAPGPVAIDQGFVSEQGMGLQGEVFKDSAGTYYIHGAPITNLSAAQVQQALTGQATAQAEAAIAHHDSTWLDSPLAPLAVFALPALIYGIPALMSAASSTGGATALTSVSDAAATAAGATGSIDTEALVAALNAQDAAQIALEQAIADVNGTLATSTVADVAQQASSIADSLSSQASAVGETVTTPAAQAAAQTAQAAAANLQTAAAAASTTSTATTAAGLLAALKTAGAAAAAVGSIIAVARGTTARPVSSISPYGTGLTYGAQSPYLTQGSLSSTNSSMLLLAAGIAAVFLLRGK